MVAPGYQCSSSGSERSANSEKDAVARLVIGERRRVLPERSALRLARDISQVQRDRRLGRHIRKLVARREIQLAAIVGEQSRHRDVVLIEATGDLLLVPCI